MRSYIAKHLGKVAPEALRNATRIHLRGQLFDGHLPRRQRIRLPTLLPCARRNAVQHGRLIVVQIERTLVIGQCGRVPAGLRGVVGKLQIGARVFRSMFELRLEIALCL